MIDRSAIMRSAWSLYRSSAYARHAFDREAFGRALAMAWQSAKVRVEVEAEKTRRVARIIIVEPIEPRPMTPMEAELDALKYLPAHMSYTRRAAEIRARYA